MRASARTCFQKVERLTEKITYVFFFSVIFFFNFTYKFFTPKETSSAFFLSFALHCSRLKETQRTEIMPLRAHKLLKKQFVLSPRTNKFSGKNKCCNVIKIHLKPFRAFCCEVIYRKWQEYSRLKFISYRWAVSPWKPCSKTCGPGLQYRSVTCMHQTRDGTTEEASSHLCPSDKPSGVQNCIEKACHMNWMVGPWSQVS